MDYNPVKMKRILSLIILSGFVLTSCSKREAPPEPIDKEALLVGDWTSQSFRINLTVNGKSVEAFDSVATGTNISFSENFKYLGYIDSTAIAGFPELADTGLYNLERDTLYLIRNARAFDTLFLKSVNENELELAVDFFNESIGGQIVSRQTIVSFLKVQSFTD
mgnify:CR=1 FL=1